MTICTTTDCGRPSETYVRPVSAMEAAARQEEARPVSFWRRLWRGLV